MTKQDQAGGREINETDKKDGAPDMPGKSPGNAENVAPAEAPAKKWKVGDRVCFVNQSRAFTVDQVYSGIVPAIGLKGIFGVFASHLFVEAPTPPQIRWLPKGTEWKPQPPLLDTEIVRMLGAIVAELKAIRSELEVRNRIAS